MTNKQAPRHVIFHTNYLTGFNQTLFLLVYLSIMDNAPKLTFKESSIVVVLRLITAELIFGLTFILVIGTLSYLSSFLGIINLFPLNLLLFLIMLAINITTLFLIILKWNSEYVEVEKGGIIKYSGILHKKEQKYACNFVEAIALDQGLLGMIEETISKEHNQQTMPFIAPEDQKNPGSEG